MALVRRSANPRTWSLGVELARRGAVRRIGGAQAEGELELQVASLRGAAATVTLDEAAGEWSCDCSAPDTACYHVTAAVIALGRAERGEAQPLAEAAAQPRQAHIIYNLEEQGGALMLRRKVRMGRQAIPLRMPLAAWRAAQPRPVDVFAEPPDVRIDTLLGVRPDEVPPRPRLAELLHQLASCDRVLLGGHKVRIEPPQSGLIGRLYERPGAIEVRLTQDPAINRIYSNGAMRRGHTICPIAPLPFDGAQLEVWRRGKVFPASDLAHVLGDVVPELGRSMPVHLGPWTHRKRHSQPPYVVISCVRDLDGEGLSWLPMLVYGNPPLARVELPADRSGPGQLRGLGPTPVQRQPEAEAEAVAALEGASPWRVGERSRARGDEAVAAALQLMAWGGPLTGDSLESFAPAGELTAVASPDSPLGVAFVSDHSPTFVPGAAGRPGAGRQASVAAVMHAWAAGHQHVRLIDGGIAPLPEAWLSAHGHMVRDILARKEMAQGEGAQKLDQARIAQALEVPPPPDLEPYARLLLEHPEGLPEAPLPKDLTASLRPYQQAGVNWLAALSRSNLGALLADDMGLGKTLQVMCVLGRRALVVAPTSVLVAWQQQLARFRPQLVAGLYHGPQRALNPRWQVTLTSYAILRLDQDKLAKVAWDTVVLDEAQAIKNPDSQVAQAAFAIRARAKVAMTGTPIENRLDELWSQMHFLNPGYLGERDDFDRTWARPIAAGEGGVAAGLRRKLAPLILRRRKTEVARDLPPRTEVVLRCTLSARERALYDAIVASTQKDVVKQLEAGGNTLAALEALLRLRQACCHTGLIPGQRQVPSSAKVELLLETLEAAAAAGHKALIFSQWTGMLDRVEPHLDGAKLAYCRLDGSTRDRQGVIDTFTHDADIRAMLISLKAGGTGLTLTAADHVFLLDPWWNPAVEDQAADRAHRLGQDKAVIIHRLIAENTVEERILRLQDHKRALVKAALEGTDGGPQSLSRDDLLMLLRPEASAA